MWLQWLQDSDERAALFEIAILDYHCNFTIKCEFLLIVDLAVEIWKAFVQFAFQHTLEYYHSVLERAISTFEFDLQNVPHFLLSILIV